ncbi:hypothetical protein SKAU_G00162430 [Synaphobranchus kaupii]|uniref:Uncharacterized protein n=1 Tax=Synaphobranchus kaupii TaxID=118154 RepID=A0A9Q1IZJ3_SYNKA|nr:hypothetical protein SKAU_G00162430 [Synaphobranchus kaupii]
MLSSSEQQTNQVTGPANAPSSNQSTGETTEIKRGAAAGDGSRRGVPEGRVLLVTTATGTRRQSRSVVAPALSRPSGHSSAGCPRSRLDNYPQCLGRRRERVALEDGQASVVSPGGRRE